MHPFLEMARNISREVFGIPFGNLASCLRTVCCVAVAMLVLSFSLNEATTRSRLRDVSGSIARLLLVSEEGKIQFAWLVVVICEKNNTCKRCGLDDLV